ncbi:hypothetical protein ACFL9S_12600 [Erwinia sp. AnSW2-5]|uniref:hypothetical protein n=1 Tax=Erwinia sp. AnSW2-5 TaxID=3367692 RepID=UPI0038585CB6
MTELEKDLLANGFSEKDLKKFRRARERAKQEEQAEGDNALDYDETLRLEIKNLGSFFFSMACFLFILLLLLNVSSILENHSPRDVIAVNTFTFSIFILCQSVVSPLRLGFKSWRYKRIKNKKK